MLARAPYHWRGDDRAVRISRMPGPGRDGKPEPADAGRFPPLFHPDSSFFANVRVDELVVPYLNYERHYKQHDERPK